MAVENAVDNALKFSEGPVRVAVFEEAETVAIEVSDEGDGVPEADRERVFEPFHRLPGARASTEGMGLGLALIAHVTTMYGGSARFAPVARGATLRITLPRLVEARD